MSAPSENLEKHGTSAPIAAQHSGGVTWRVVLLSLVLAAMFGVLSPINDYKNGNTYIGAAHLPPGAVVVLLCLVGLHFGLRALGRLGDKFALTRNETLTVYITCLFSVLVSGRASENFFVPNVIGSFYFATRENRWLEFLQPYLKPWFTPALRPDGTYNAELVQDWYTGLAPGQSIPWGAWLVPLFAWTLLILALYTMLACLSIMMRAQWVENEALAFPLLKLPLEMTEGTESGTVNTFFRSTATWVGFGATVLVRGLTGLSLYYPDVPPVYMGVNMGPLLTEAPWNQIGQLPVQILPLVTGISFLLTAEVSLSFWFFFLFHKFEMMAAYYMGFAPGTLPDPAWTRGWAKSFISYQNIGAYFAFAAILLWTGREHYGHILRRAIGRAPRGQREASEALSYPVAFWGFVLSSAFLVAWAAAAGVRWDVAAIMWLTYMVIAVALTRVIAEGGLLYVNHGWSPLGPLAHLLGGGPGTWLAPSSAVPASIIQGSFMIDMKAFLLPSFLHAWKLAHDRKINMRPLLGLICAVTLLSYGLAVWTNVRLGYENGGLQLHPWFARQGAQDPALNAREFLRPIEDNYLLNWLWFGVGAAVTYGLVLARAHFAWFPLHPVGFIMWTPFVMHQMWVSIFLGWLAKVLVMKYGGTDAYRKVLPGFLGLALGDVFMMIFWAIIAAWQGRTGHMLMPG